MSILTRLRYELRAFGKYFRLAFGSVWGAVAIVLSFWAVVAYMWSAFRPDAPIEAPPWWVFVPVVSVAVIFGPYQAIRLLLLGKPNTPNFLELKEGPRLFGAQGGKPPRHTRYTFCVPEIEAWPEPRRLIFRCTKEIAEPTVTINEHPMVPSQCEADIDFFRVDFILDTDKLSDGVDIFVRYYSWEPGARLFSVSTK